MAELSTKKRVRDDSVESDLDPVDVKKLRDDLLSLLDDSDADPTTLELDSVMKSFHDEISPESSSSPVLLIDQPAESGESQRELGYLLEASDDELGLPPSVASTSPEEIADGSELVPVPSDWSEISEFRWFDKQIPAYDSLEWTGEDRTTGETNKVEYGPFDLLFDHSDVLYFEPSDYSEIFWRHESTPAQ